MEPFALLGDAVIVLHITVFSTEAAPFQGHPKASNHHALRDCVGHGLDKIPSKPRHTEYSVIAQSELNSEECSGSIDAKHVPAFLRGFDLIFTLTSFVVLLLS